MRTPRVLTAVIAVALLAACGQSPPPPPTTTGPAVAPPPPAVASAPAPPPSPSTPDRRPDTTGAGGTIKGRTVWPNVGDFRFTLQIVLLGDDPVTEGRMIAVRTRLGEPYSAWVVPAGGYVLKAQVGSIRLWEMRVNVEPDKETVVDLTPAESRVSPTEFPVKG
jgi:hypothetical protein